MSTAHLGPKNARPTPPARYEIAEWWEENAETAYPEYLAVAFDSEKPPYFWDFVMDSGEPACFACHWFYGRARTYDAASGYTNLRRIWDDAHLERAHIVPYAMGSSNHVSNYLLLCKECHKEAPD